MKKEIKFIPYDIRLTEKARENRRKPIDRFIVDFYCSELKLAVEIDGDSHDGQREYGEQRTRKLNGLGITVIRYMNSDVLRNLNGVYLDLKNRVENLRKTKTVGCSI